MYPELFKIGPFTVYSYGLMMGIAFIVASYILIKEFERKKLNPSAATEITLLAIVFGVIGSKLLDLIENWNSFIRNPSIAFSPGGLTFYGGFILGTIAIFIYVKKKKYSFLYIADATSPSLILAYGIGRIGCQLSGDGDYGIPTNLPWGMTYPNGTVKPHNILKVFYQNHPALAVKDHFHQLSSQIVGYDHYGTITKFDEVIRLHPTPIYEFLACLIIFFILWKLRKKDWADGKLFMVFLLFAGIERFTVEFIRLNPKLLFGLTEAQLISIVLIMIGLPGYIYLTKNKDKLHRFIPPPYKKETKKVKG
ncbi:MAG TPA: prolipoprotein diacylglyceryl transferase [Ignavibacteria bacterium]|nr:prolipoprotein diacylglyceryl transferase [Ignavibacteria bacterium]